MLLEFLFMIGPEKIAESMLVTLAGATFAVHGALLSKKESKKELTKGPPYLVKSLV
jgi:hypothetical protein